MLLKPQEKSLQEIPLYQIAKGLAGMRGFFLRTSGAFQRAASCLLVNKKNYLLQPRKAGGGLEGAACLRPHLPQYRAPFRLSPLVFWGIKRITFCNRPKQEAALKAPPASDRTCRNQAPFWAAFYLLVNKKNYLLQPRKAGGGLEGAACLQPHLPNMGTFWGLLGRVGFFEDKWRLPGPPLVFWGIKKNYLLQPRKAGGGLEGAACHDPLAVRAPFGRVGLFLRTSGAFQGRLLSFGE
ncbi:MAG: hypothetical protein IPI18_17565 [Saprospiraceae bacterium]|nr:hypothetical protein [Saprospiraceae bacterium]